MKNIYDYTYEMLEEYFVENNEKKFKVQQIYDWLYKKKVTSFFDMANIKKELRDKLSNDILFDMIKIVEIKKENNAIKYLFELLDGNYIEAVLMFHNYGNSLCVSSQVGCNMGCKFCESGRLKKIRNLNTYEMVEQILLIEKEENIKISHVVLMGIGEPLDNYDNVINFVKIINHNKGLEIGARHITLSTCGVIPKIKLISNLGLQVNLAISLHAPNNEIRNKLMPINKIYDINELIKCLKEYIKITNRRVTFEYILLKNVNDSSKCAEDLAHLIRGMNCYVNIIPYNETNNIDYYRSDKNTIMNFYDILKKNKINVTIRQEFGSNIDAACGQLRSKKEGNL